MGVVGTLRVALFVSMIGSVMAGHADAVARELVFATITPDRHQWTQAARVASADVSRKTDGTLTIRIISDGLRGNDVAILTQIALGQLDGALVTGAELSDRIPWIADLMNPAVVENPENLHQSVVAAVKARLTKDGTAGAFRLIGLGAGGLRQMVFSRGIDWQAGIAGNPVRVPPGNVMGKFYEGLGARPQALPLPVVRRAWEQSALDVVDMDLEMIVLDRYPINGGTLVLTRHMSFPVVAVVSSAVYESLDEQQKDILFNAFCRNLATLDHRYQGLEAEWIAALRSSGLNVVEERPQWLNDSVRAYPVAPWLLAASTGVENVEEGASCVQ